MVLWIVNPSPAYMTILNISLDENIMRQELYTNKLNNTQNRQRHLIKISKDI